MVPMVREHLGGNGNSMLTASLLLGMMILPTIIGVALSSIRAVPESYYEGSLALGASHERSVFFVVFPAAKSGVMAGVILGVAAPSAKRWPSSWSRATSRACPRASSKACAR